MPRRDPKNVTRFWVDPTIPGLSLMRAEFTTHEFPPHTHQALVVAVTESGGSSVKSRGVVEPAHNGALFVFNPAEPHAGWMGGSSYWRYRAFYLAKPAIDEVARHLGIARVPNFTRNLFTDRDLIERFLELHAACETPCPDVPHAELMASLFGALFERYGSGGNRIAQAPADGELLRRCLEMMHDRFAEPLLLDDLGRAFGLTSFQLIGLFKRRLGLTPHAYLTQVRLNMACRLLKRAHAPAEIAAACGFYDQSAMNNCFKRCYAITPLQFARANTAAAAH